MARNSPSTSNWNMTISCSMYSYILTSTTHITQGNKSGIVNRTSRRYTRDYLINELQNLILSIPHWPVVN